jgi:SAM-dependent methyltransferase
VSLKSNSEWEILARADPLFAIASDKNRRKSKSKWTVEEFFGKGVAYMQLLSPGLSDIPPEATVLEIGCGAGRITRALASRFRFVIGVDAAPTMVTLAKEMCGDIANVKFQKSNASSSPFRTKALMPLSRSKFFSTLIEKACLKSLRNVDAYFVREV